MTDMQKAMTALFDGEFSEAQAISFLENLRDKGETADEILGVVHFLRHRMIPVDVPGLRLMDVCGTGGDAKNTFNISTAVAFVLAGAGIPVAKHGNRAVTSQSGSADVLKALGVNVDVTPAQVVRCIREIGIGFLFAPSFHPVLKNVAVVRKKIGTRTVFNIVGPLVNPACPACQVVGVYSPSLLWPVAQVLQKLGVTGVVVHGEDGLDEVTLTGKTKLCWVQGDQIIEDSFDPQTVGYAYCTPESLQGGDAIANARRLKKVLKGHSEPVDHCVHLNAALALKAYGRVSDMKEGLLVVQESISSGKAFEKLERLIEVSNMSA